MIMLNIFEYYYDYVCDEECGNAYDDSDSSCNDEDSCYDRDDMTMIITNLIVFIVIIMIHCGGDLYYGLC